MNKDPRINFDRPLADILLDCSLLRWFADNGRCEDALIAIDIQRSLVKDPEGQVLDFLVSHVAGQR